MGEEGERETQGVVKVGAVIGIRDGLSEVGREGLENLGDGEGEEKKGQQ
jgi:hypothetical protein